MVPASPPLQVYAAVILQTGSSKATCADFSNLLDIDGRHQIKLFIYCFFMLSQS
jgi:hypothetical protein